MSFINGTLMQYFHWYYPDDGSLWEKVTNESKELSELGITALWLPPAYKCQAGTFDVGYGVYDIYDLGEFNQKGTIRTKYGTKNQYIEAIKSAQNNNIQIYADMVFNHRGGADETELVEAYKMDLENRNQEIGLCETIEAWTKFNFPGRNKQYSDFEWSAKYFDAVDWDQKKQEKGIFKLKESGPNWEWEVSNEKGNYDYLMFADIDFREPDVLNEMRCIGEWYLNTTNVNGFRLDALKHIRYSFFRDWLEYVRNYSSKELFTVGEYWCDKVDTLENYLNCTQGKMSLFDVPLHFNFYNASRSSPQYDMRKLLDNTLVQKQPCFAVTFIDNHDSQPLQALESTVDWWFKPLAYSIILLRQEGYPCIFFPDYYGASYNDKGYNIILAPVPKLKELLKARKTYAFGKQIDYFDHNNIVGWTRLGDNEHPESGIAVIMSNGAGGSKPMFVGERFAGKTFYDYLGNVTTTVNINANGYGDFSCNGGSVSVWVCS